jgi:hypothetical protein
MSVLASPLLDPEERGEREEEDTADLEFSVKSEVHSQCYVM